MMDERSAPLAEPVVLWRNSAVKQCPYCPYSEGANLNLLRDHIVNHHRKFIVAYMAGQGIKDLATAAWRLVDGAKMPKVALTIERVDA